MGTPLAISIPGNLGNIAGAGSDGVFAGQMTPAALSKFLLASYRLPALCYTDDGGTYVDKTADFGDADADDVDLLPATPAVDDAIYFGHGTKKFTQVAINISTPGEGAWTLDWQYWDGDEWQDLAGVTDGTEAFTADAGIRTVSFTEPTDWEKNTVDSVLGYWVRANVATYDSITTQPLATDGNVVSVTAQFTDDTTDANDSDTGDVALLPTQPQLGDAAYFGYSARFCKIKITVSQARTGTATLALKYWNGTSWAAVSIVADDTVGFSVSGTKYIHFSPPADWVANTVANGPNGQAGFFVRMEITALTSVTQQPLGTQAWVLPLQTGTSGIPMNFSGSVTKITADALTVSGSTADSVFILVNKTKNTFVVFTWTKATARVSSTVSLAFSSGDELLLVQITEDGTTEFANASLYLAM